MKTATIWFEEGNLYVKLSSPKGVKVVKIQVDAVDYTRLIEGKRIRGW